MIPDKNGNGGIRDYIEALSLFKVLCQEGWFNFLPCGRTTALSRTSKWAQGENPFIGILQEQFLEPLTQQESLELLATLGIKAGIHFEDAAIERVFALAGGHPFFTRTLGSWILEKHTKSRISASLVEEATQAYLSQGAEKTLLLKIYNDELEDEEKRILKEITVSNRPIDRVDLVPYNSNEQELRKINDAVENLLATSVIKQDENGQLSHRYELLRRAIEEDIKELAKYSLR